jgi:hypothetical protein
MARKTNLAVTEAARQAGTVLASWRAVEAEAQNQLEAAKVKAASANFAEFHFHDGRFCGVVKAGDLVVKVEG